MGHEVIAWEQVLVFRGASGHPAVSFHYNERCLHLCEASGLRSPVDKNPGDEVAAEKFKEISVAYTILSDPNKRHRCCPSSPCGLPYSSTRHFDLCGLSYGRHPDFGLLSR